MGVPFTPPPPAAVMRLLSQFEREQLAGFIAVAIELLDISDGDPDLEPNGDELDSTGSDDDPLPPGVISHRDWLPGDPADTEVAWHEWPGCGRLKLTWDSETIVVAGVNEDDEDADPDTGVEDCPLGFDPEEDMGAEEAGEQEEREIPFYGLDQTRGPICETEACRGVLRPVTAAL